MSKSNLERFFRFVRSPAIAITLFATCTNPASTVANEAVVGNIQIEQPWSRATPGGARVGGGFVTLKNTGTTPDRLVAVETTIADRAEIHEMKMDNGIMRMRRLADGLPLPAGKTMMLKPGSYHLMFIGLKDGIKKGQPFKATLIFEQAGRIELTFNVLAIGTSPKKDSHQGAHTAK